MTNTLRETRVKAGMTIIGLAKDLGVDPTYVSLAEAGSMMVRLDMAFAIAGILEAPLQELFPAAQDALSVVTESENPYEDANREEIFAALVGVGIDPDPSEWVAIIEFDNGCQRRYPLSSADRADLSARLRGRTRGFIVFHSDARLVAVRAGAISRCRIEDDASYQQWDSREQAFEVVLIRDCDDRPERYDVVPDEVSSPDEIGVFGSALMSLESGDVEGSFLAFDTEDGTEILVRVETLMAAEIPVGVIRPSLYADDAPSLEEMIIQGSA